MSFEVIHTHRSKFAAPGVSSPVVKLPALTVGFQLCATSQIAKFMGPTWGPPGSCRSQMGPMLTPWTLLSGVLFRSADVNPSFMAQWWVTGEWLTRMPPLWAEKTILQRLGDWLITCILRHLLSIHLSMSRLPLWNNHNWIISSFTLDCSFILIFSWQQIVWGLSYLYCRCCWCLFQKQQHLNSWTALHCKKGSSEIDIQATVECRYNAIKYCKILH